METTAPKAYTSTRNACKVCTPLGASIAFKGIAGCVPLIHGSQGCATYIRRYLISHYKEPVDIASSGFSEQSAIFGGQQNLNLSIKNVTASYRPQMIGISTTCLSETIGDDMHKILSEYRKAVGDQTANPDLVHVSTPSYMGTHADGFHNTVLSLIKHYAVAGPSSQAVNLLPGFISTADLRQLKEVMSAFGLETILVPDYSEILDYTHTNEYERIPEGGTTIYDLKQTGKAKATIEFGYILNKSNPKAKSAGEYLETEFSVPRANMNIPIGIKATDAFFKTLEELTGQPTPEKFAKQRGRLVDAYIDGHKYLFGKKAVVYGEEDFVVGMVSFLEEIGIETVLCASGGNSGLLRKVIDEKVQPRNTIEVHNDYDFETIAAKCEEIKPDLLIGNSKGYYIARKLGIPLVRLGFPIHDRVGGQRIKHVCYEGTQELFDVITNTLIQSKQDNSPVGYKYM